MKKIITLFICCLLIVLPGCSASTKYKRISFDSETLGEKFSEYLDDNTMVVNSVSDDSLPDKLPIYKISERKISEGEFQQMLKLLEIDKSIDSTQDLEVKLKGNEINVLLKSFTDTSAGDFNITKEELEKLAWETFNKLPFMDGEYEYLGIKTRTTLSDSKGTITYRLGVSFCRTIDGIGIAGNDRCDLAFDNSGLIQINIKLYNYKKIGTMDLVPLKSASSMIKNPDDFTVYDEKSKSGLIEKLEAEKVKLWYYNMYSDGCTILEPVYNYTGTAADVDGKENRFSSIIIAIPESYTYVEKNNTSDE